MAERRMISKRFINRDSFLDLNLSAQALYFHLVLEADDDGFVESPNGIARKIGASKDDIKALDDNGFIISFSSGVLVVRHWHLHNHVTEQKYRATEYQKEYNSIFLDENKTYQTGMNQKSIQNVYDQYTDSIRKDAQYSPCKISPCYEREGQEIHGVLLDGLSPLSSDEIMDSCGAKSSEIDPDQIYYGILAMDPDKADDELIRCIRVYMNHVGFNSWHAEGKGGIEAWLRVLLITNEVPVESLLNAIKETAEHEPDNHIAYAMTILKNKGVI